jgi:hypothetical protein
VIILVWFVLAIVVGAAASDRFNRSGPGWFFVALFTSPLIAILFLLAVGKKPGESITVDWQSIDWSGEHKPQKINGSRPEQRRACQAWRDRVIAAKQRKA